MRHSLPDMVRHRTFAIVLGYEDLNDHDKLHHDPALRTAVERDTELASAPILCHLEN